MCREMPSNPTKCGWSLKMPFGIPSTFDSNGTFAIDAYEKIDRLAANVAVGDETLA